MEFFGGILELLDTSMNKPSPYGWFHLLSFAISIIVAIILCVNYKSKKPFSVRMIILIVAILVSILEIYKQVNYSFSYGNDGISFDYQWYIFPWQFCSMPMFVGLLAGLTKKGKLHDSLCAFLATYAIFAGLCVMFYPVTVFTETIGVNIQTMVCHGSMITVGIYLLYTGYVKLEHKTILKALPVFAVAVLIATTLNEIAYYSGLLETEEFNMFFISPHVAPSLPVYSLVQGVVPYPWCMFIYLAAFTIASYLIVLICMGIQKFIYLIRSRKVAQNVQRSQKMKVKHS